MAVMPSVCIKVWCIIEKGRLSRCLGGMHRVRRFHGYCVMEWPAGVNVVSLASSLSIPESGIPYLVPFTCRRLVVHD